MNKNNGILQLGKEYLQQNEQEDILEIIQMQKNKQLRLYRNADIRRQNHNKSYGCVKAEFIIEKNLPEHLRVGIFKESRSFPAWIRLSPQHTTNRHDKKKDVRGFAIKLMNVPGQKCLESLQDGQTHDFQMVSIPTFFIDTLANFRTWMKASTSANKLAIPMFLLRNTHIAKRLLKMFKPCRHPLEIPYYGITPYRFGSETTAVKYMLRPSEGNVLEYTDERDHNFLYKNVMSTVVKHEVCYDFCIQFQEDPYAMPIEDSTVEWKSPFIRVAQIRIPRQSLTSPAHLQFAENLSFNLFHCLPEHKPLGGINRCRKIMYESLALFRLDRNKQKLTEPTAGADFFVPERMVD